MWKVGVSGREDTVAKRMLSQTYRDRHKGSLLGSVAEGIHHL